MSGIHDQRSWNRLQIFIKNLAKRLVGESLRSILAWRLGIFTVSVFLGAYVAIRILDIITYNMVTSYAPKKYLIYREMLMNGNGIGKAGIAEFMKISEQYDQILWISQYAEVTLICVLTLFVVARLSSATAGVISSPIAELSKGAEAIANGATATRVRLKAGLPLEIASLTASFNAMAAQLEKMEQDRKLAAAAVAHELATPLMIVRGRLQGMLDDIYEPDRQNLEKLVAQVDVLGRLVEDLRTLSLYTAGNINLNKVDVDLDAMIADVIGNFDERQYGLHFIRRGVAGTAAVDGFRFRQMLTAVVENALKYAADGGIVEVVSTRPVAWERAPGVSIMVIDHGEGFKASDLPHVFDPFWRGVEAAGGGPRGTGLGLSVVRTIVQAHGGRVSAGNHPGGGAQVDIWLPTTAAASAP